MCLVFTQSSLNSMGRCEYFRHPVKSISRICIGIFQVRTKSSVQLSTFRGTKSPLNVFHNSFFNNINGDISAVKLKGTRELNVGF